MGTAILIGLGYIGWNKLQSLGIAITTNEVKGTRVPFSEAGGSTLPQSGVLVDRSTNGVAVQVKAEKDARVTVNIRNAGGTDPNGPKWPIGFEPDRTEVLDPTSGENPHEGGDVRMESELEQGEDVVFPVPFGWGMKATTYSSREVYDIKINNSDPKGRIVSSDSIRIRNKGSSTLKIGWVFRKGGFPTD